MGTKIVDIVWIGGGTTIGVVLCSDDITQKYSARIASVRGEDEDVDAKCVKDWGTKLTFTQAKGFFPKITEEEYKI